MPKKRQIKEGPFTIRTTDGGRVLLKYSGRFATLVPVKARAERARKTMSATSVTVTNRWGVLIYDAVRSGHGMPWDVLTPWPGYKPWAKTLVLPI